MTLATAGRDTCTRTAPSTSRPLVTIPRALKFNDAIAVDLAELPPLGRFLHIVDLGTRLAKAVATPNKETTAVSRALLSGWLIHHCPPRALLADLCGESYRVVWRTTAELHNIALF